MHTIVASAGWLVGVGGDTPVSAPRKWGSSGQKRGRKKKGRKREGRSVPPSLSSLPSSTSRWLLSPLSLLGAVEKIRTTLDDFYRRRPPAHYAPRPCAHAGFARARAAQRTVYTAWGVRLHLCVRATLAVMVAAAKSAGKRSTKPVERLVSGELPAAPPSPTRRNVHHVTESPWTSAKLRARLTCYSHPPARPPT